MFRIVWPADPDDIEEDGDQGGKKKSKKKGDKDDKGATLTGSKVAAATVGGVVVGAMTAGTFACKAVKLCIKISS